MGGYVSSYEWGYDEENHFSY
ncbi:MAG: hypothetical protein J07AB43_01140 [Candidatus Nanosalina sp. J07AB43]|nr:MAG: hypothetical protein J07AB43_01140 [Candidatus Nanosalina sp. J07AB43]